MSETDIILGVATFGIIGAVFGYLKFASRNFAVPILASSEVEVPKTQAERQNSEQAQSPSANQLLFSAASGASREFTNGSVSLPRKSASAQFSKVAEDVAHAVIVTDVVRRRRGGASVYASYAPSVTITSTDGRTIEKVPGLAVAEVRDLSAIRQRARKLKKAQTLLTR